VVEIKLMTEGNHPDPGPKDAVGTTPAAAGTGTKPSTEPPRLLPPWKVILHNDDKNFMEYVVARIRELTPLSKQEAILCAQDAHRTGCALVLVTHQERAELYVDQFTSCGLTVTAETDA
jgi:ATP-dependent Clp protease adaptor protein ClpS